MKLIHQYMYEDFVKGDSKLQLGWIMIRISHVVIVRLVVIPKPMKS